VFESASAKVGYISVTVLIAKVCLSNCCLQRSSASVSIMPLPSIHWIEIPALAPDALKAFQRLSQQTVLCKELGPLQVNKICEGDGDEIVLTGCSLGFGGVGWWAYCRRSEHQCFSHPKMSSLAHIFSNNPRNLGIWCRKSLARSPGKSMPPTIIALMSSRAVMTKIVEITSSPGDKAGTMCISLFHALSGEVLLSKRVMSIRAHGATVAKMAYLLVTRAASARQCTVVVKLLWDGRYIYKDKVVKTRLKHLLSCWSIGDVLPPTEPSAKRYRINGKSCCNWIPSAGQCA
jgi:hypothetical protein